MCIKETRALYSTQQSVDPYYTSVCMVNICPRLHHTSTCNYTQYQFTFLWLWDNHGVINDENYGIIMRQSHYKKI